MIKFFCEVLPEKAHHYLAKTRLLLKAYCRNETFYCRALAGESDYNICINCDLTVSCNCQDYDGSGQIGDLKEQSLEQIFHGTAANNFRSKLADRKFPIPTCVHCADFRLVSRKEINSLLLHCHVPHKGIMVENTALCNLRCHACNRAQLVKIRHGKLLLSIVDVEKIASLLKENDVKSLFYFNLGEPFIPDDIYDQIKTIRAKNPDIRIITSTNGLLLDSNDKIEAALLMDYIYISLDGVTQESVSRYQVGGNFEKSYQNMARVCKARNERGTRFPIIEWKYVLFRWNDKPDQIKKAIELARNAKVDLIAFYNGDAPPLNKSLKWHYHSFFKHLGKKMNGSIIINLNQIPDELLSP
jgi:wyosine [tRNA(Phe)-imidazoG37] synthetase (radical SAM superfamily)